eukprot:gb/GEZN01002056.1/.p1 GENE.gb/GEZN01002056.1/~~gb/GEZN01002056.1/.p1  ORF type:complete len:707 (+),score=197.37 gb/GEZN01002056.1/:66-2186(+)
MDMLVQLSSQRETDRVRWHDAFQAFESQFQEVQTPSFNKEQKAAVIGYLVPGLTSNHLTWQGDDLCLALNALKIICRARGEGLEEMLADSTLTWASNTAANSKEQLVRLRASQVTLNSVIQDRTHCMKRIFSLGLHQQHFNGLQTALKDLEAKRPPDQSEEAAVRRYECLLTMARLVWLSCLEDDLGKKYIDDFNLYAHSAHAINQLIRLSSDADMTALLQEGRLGNARRKCLSELLKCVFAMAASSGRSPITAKMPQCDVELLMRNLSALLCRGVRFPQFPWDEEEADHIAEAEAEWERMDQAEAARVARKASEAKAKQEQERRAQQRAEQQAAQQLVAQEQAAQLQAGKNKKGKKGKKKGKKVESNEETEEERVSREEAEAEAWFQEQSALLEEAERQEEMKNQQEAKEKEEKEKDLQEFGDRLANPIKYAKTSRPNQSSEQKSSSDRDSKRQAATETAEEDEGEMSFSEMLNKLPQGGAGADEPDPDYDKFAAIEPWPKPTFPENKSDPKTTSLSDLQSDVISCLCYLPESTVALVDSDDRATIALCRTLHKAFLTSTKQQLSGRIIPVLTALGRLAKTSSRARKVAKAEVYQHHRRKRLGEGPNGMAPFGQKRDHEGKRNPWSLRAQLAEHITSYDSIIKSLVCEFIFQLADETPDEYMRLVGIGYGVGLMAERGIPGFAHLTKNAINLDDLAQSMKKKQGG